MWTISKMEDEKAQIHSPGQLLESFSRCTKNGFVASNLKGEITFFSSMMERLTGWYEAEMLGKHVSKLYVMPDISNPEDLKDVKSQAAVLYTRSGKKLTLPTRATKILSLEDPNCVEGELVIFLTDLHEKDLDKIQSGFISTVSHELRTPITSIKGFADTLLHHKQGLDEAKRKKYTRIIKDQAERLSRLVEDLLAVSRLENRKLQLTIQPIQIKSVLEKIAIIIESKYNYSHTINLSASDSLPQVWVDPDRVEQILTNLIDNAVKYSPTSDKVDIKVTSESETKSVRIDIVDYGIGIDKNDLHKIFRKFSRLDNPLTRQTEGTGLGLYISKSLVRLLHGDLLVESEGGKTVFTVILPTESFDAGELWWD